MGSPAAGYCGRRRSFPNTEVRSTAVLYEKKLTTPGYEGFADVKINGDKKVSLTLDADINHLELDTESTVSTTPRMRRSTA